MSEGVVTATVDQVKTHPYIWGAIIFVVLVGVYFLSGKSSSGGQTQAFNFSYGPSDAQVAAGTALQIAQVNANAQSAQIAQQTTTANEIAQTYFGYLTNNSANALTATQDQIAANVAINGQNVNSSTYIAGLQSNDQLAQIAAQQNVALNTGNWNYLLGLASTASNERVSADAYQTQYQVAALKAAGG